MRRAAEPLGNSGDTQALQFLAEQIRGPTTPWRVRKDAVTGLKKAGRIAGPYVRTLAESGAHPLDIAWALRDTGSPGDVNLLLPYLSRRGIRLRLNTVLVLDDLNGPGTQEGLVLALSDRRLFVRAAAMEQ
jgi:HEAT repeat protein